MILYQNPAQKHYGRQNINESGHGSRETYGYISWDKIFRHNILTPEIYLNFRFSIHFPWRSWNGGSFKRSFVLNRVRISNSWRHPYPQTWVKYPPPNPSASTLQLSLHFSLFHFRCHHLWPQLAFFNSKSAGKSDDSDDALIRVIRSIELAMRTKMLLNFNDNLKETFFDETFPVILSASSLQQSNAIFINCLA